MKPTKQQQLEQFQKIVQNGFAHLQAEKAYRQVNILRKLKSLQLTISPTSFSHILKGKAMGYDVLHRAEKGIRQIVEVELGLRFEENKGNFVPLPAEERTLELIEEFDPGKSKQTDGILFRPDGRMSVQEKLDFLESAQQEIVEMGVRLNTLRNQFSHLKEKELVLPIKEFLDRGVNIKLYLLDPDYQGTHFYFDDRGEVEEKEKKSPEQIKQVIRDLKAVYKKHEFGKHEGNFELYTYRHLPYNRFLIVDGESYNAKMIVSNYLYGIRRAQCPSVECAKLSSPDLYKNYWTSFELLAAKAKPIKWETI